MSKRPRRSYRRYEPEPAPPPIFSIDRLLSLGATPLITALITAVGFYFTTTSTLQQQADQIKQTNAKVEQLSKQVDVKTSDDTTAREKIREAFITNQTKTNEGIAKLDTRLAVAEEQQKSSIQQLTKISDTLEKLSNFALGNSSRK